MFDILQMKSCSKETSRKMFEDFSDERSIFFYNELKTNEC